MIGTHRGGVCQAPNASATTSDSSSIGGVAGDHQRRAAWDERATMERPDVVGGRRLEGGLVSPARGGRTDDRDKAVA